MQYPEIAWPHGAPINIKIVARTLGYPVELNHHNALTFSQRAALDYPGLLIPVTTAEDCHQTSQCKQWIKVLDHFIQRLSWR